MAIVGTDIIQTALAWKLQARYLYWRKADPRRYNWFESLNADCSLILRMNLTEKSGTSPPIFVLVGAIKSFYAQQNVIVS